MHTLICGSLAFDTIMVFQDQFKNHILPDKIHSLSVSFYVPEMRREFGGTAGNIAYNLQLLEGKPLIMGTVGEDFSSYTSWLNQNNINTQHIKKLRRALPHRPLSQQILMTTKSRHFTQVQWWSHTKTA